MAYKKAKQNFPFVQKLHFYLNLLYHFLHSFFDNFFVFFCLTLFFLFFLNFSFEKTLFISEKNIFFANYLIKRSGFIL